MNRILQEDGRILIVAMDHTLFMDKPMAGLVRYSDTVKASVANGADAFLSPLGSVRAYPDAYGSSVVICSVDPAGEGGRFAVETAARAGADAVKCMVYPFGEDTMLDKVTSLSAQTAAIGMPFLAEPIPGSFARTDLRSPEIIASGCRICMEAGADMVKTFYPGTPEGMRKVVDYAGVPVVVLGGSKKNSLAELYAEVYDAVIQGGASGVAIGTNIWTAEDPGAVVKGLTAILHEGASVEQALSAAGASG